MTWSFGCGPGCGSCGRPASGRTPPPSPRGPASSPRRPSSPSGAAPPPAARSLPSPPRSPPGGPGAASTPPECPVRRLAPPRPSEVRRSICRTLVSPALAHLVSQIGLRRWRRRRQSTERPSMNRSPSTRRSKRRSNPYPAGRPVKAVIRRIGRRWEAVVCYELPVPQQYDNGRIIGVDRNAGQVADSDGEIHRMPDLKRRETRLKRHQRSLSRKRKDSRRREKQRIRVQRASRRPRNARRNWQHHGSRRIAAKAQTAVIEKLSTKGMTKSARGATGRPGTNARRKSGLNRVILHTGWAALKQMLEYKAAELIEVPAGYTSQTGSGCGIIDPHSRRSQSRFRCVACGHAQNADLNAARNIRASGTGAVARRGAPAAATPSTRQMDTMVSRHDRI